MDDNPPIADGPEAEVTAKRKPLAMRTKALVGLFVFISFTFGVNAAHVHMLENELRVIAEEKEQAERERADRLGVPIETAYIVTVSKEYLVYGDIFGKIEVYMRQPGTEKRIIGMDYFLERANGDWSVFESGTCTDDMCQTRGTKALAAK